MQAFMDENGFKVILFVITVLVTIFSTFVIPLIKEKYEGTAFGNVLDRIALYVEAAEKLFGSGTGATKKDYVTKLLKLLLIKKHLSLSEDEISAIITAIAERLFPDHQELEDAEIDDEDESGGTVVTEDEDIE